MTPAINEVRKAKISYKLHKYAHDPTSTAYGEEAAQKLGVSQARLFKTLVVSSDKNELSVAILPVASKLNLKLFAKACGSKNAALADRKIAERTTGYVVGGISPIGQKKTLLTIIHDTIKEFDTVFVSAGKRGVQIELAPDDLARLTQGKYDCICDN